LNPTQGARAPLAGILRRSHAALLGPKRSPVAWFSVFSLLTRLRAASLRPPTPPTPAFSCCFSIASFLQSIGCQVLRRSFTTRVSGEPHATTALASSAASAMQHSGGVAAREVQAPSGADQRRLRAASRTRRWQRNELDTKQTTTTTRTTRRMCLPVGRRPPPAPHHPLAAPQREM
jgi:hypothetical protein